jgi:predicted enzyme related to lactoylglutathione lyase
MDGRTVPLLLVDIGKYVMPVKRKAEPMISAISHTYVWVEDQDRALDFYRRMLEFEVRDDVRIGERRWLTVGPADQPDVRVVLTPISAQADPTVAANIRQLLASGVVVAGGLTTDDCRGTHADLTARGVRFVEPPADRPYGTEAVFADDSGNLWGMVQPR